MGRWQIQLQEPILSDNLIKTRKQPLLQKAASSQRLIRKLFHDESTVDPEILQALQAESSKRLLGMDSKS